MLIATGYHSDYTKPRVTLKLILYKYFVSKKC